MNEPVLRGIFCSWYNLIKNYISGDDFSGLLKELEGLYKKSPSTIFPQQKDVFKPFKITPLDRLSVVFIKIQPYDNKDANGLAIANNNDVFPIHPYCFKFYKEIETNFYDGMLLDIDFSMESYSKQGILFLNGALTISKKGYHIDMWSDFTINLLKQLAINKSNIIYVFLDAPSLIFKEYIDEAKNKVVLADIESDNFSLPLKQMDNYISKNHGIKINW